MLAGKSPLCMCVLTSVHLMHVRHQPMLVVRLRLQAWSGKPDNKHNYIRKQSGRILQALRAGGASYSQANSGILLGQRGFRLLY